MFWYNRQPSISQIITLFHCRQGSAQNKAFPGKLTQIKEFPIERSNQLPYKLQKALIDQKIVPCINVRYCLKEKQGYWCKWWIFCRPYVFHDLMMSLPDFVKHFFPDLPLEKSREMLQEILKVKIILQNYGSDYQSCVCRLFSTRGTQATRKCFEPRENAACMTRSPSSSLKISWPTCPRWSICSGKRHVFIN